MNYRTFKAAGIDVSLLGFGAMRLPVIDGDPGKIIEDEAIRMIRHAIDNGVNYIDTAYVYHKTLGEALVGKALKDGYREKTLVATKLPYWLLNGPEDFEATFNEQLEKLQVDCIDMYLLHDIANAERWNMVKDWKLFDALMKKRDSGKIRFIGFSFHGETPAEFIEVIDEYPWDFCQLQINYMDKNLQAGVEGYEYAVAKGIPIVVMEPLKGGKLTDVMPPSVMKYWSGLGSGRSPAEWAFRWVANLPGVLTILSGMSTMEQLEENLRIFSDPGTDEGKLTEAELAIIDTAADEYRKLIPYHCTACKYCLPCTEGILIPQVMDFRNFCDLYGKTAKLRAEFNFFVKVKPSNCSACGKCEAECPQHLEIIQAMKEASDLLED